MVKVQSVFHLFAPDHHFNSPAEADDLIFTVFSHQGHRSSSLSDNTSRNLPSPYVSVALPYLYGV